MDIRTELHIPEHIGVIIDGNRRYAKKHLIEIWKGHKKGADVVEETLDNAKDLGIRKVTIYCLSNENILKRSKTELDFLYKIFRDMFRRLEGQYKEKDTKIKFIGRLEMLPEDLQHLCTDMEKKTEDMKGFQANFCIAYGGRQEIIDCIRKIVKDNKDPEDIKEETITNNLMLPDEPDLIIRTGGKTRTSNFLPWQSTYSEWFFLEKMWPEFTKQDLIQIIEDFNKVQRNFGK